MDAHIGSSPTAIIRMPLEWDAVNGRTYRQQSYGNYQSATCVGCLQHAWDVQLGNAWPVAVINLLSTQVGGLYRAHSSEEAT